MSHTFGVLIFLMEGASTLLRHLNDICLGISLTNQQISKICKGSKEASESHRNVTLDMSSLRIMVKRSRRKKEQEDTGKQQHVIVTENNSFKGFTIEGLN